MHGLAIFWFVRLVRFIVGWIYVFSTDREKAEKEAAERAKLQAAEESDDGVVVGKVR